MSAKGAAESKASEVMPIIGMYAVKRAPMPGSIDFDGVPVERAQPADPSIVAEFDVVKVVLPGGFNDLGTQVPRDETRSANTTKDIIKMMNIYEYGDSIPGVACGVLSTVATLGYYYYTKRIVVPPSFFGHYRSSGRDFFVGPGRYTLMSSTDVWIDRRVPIDDEAHLTRQFGSKTLLYVPENHIGGAFRVGLVDDLCEDGDYVIFPQGHHVLPNDNYRSTSVVRLGGESVVRLGPLTMLFVKEGHIAGAYNRKEAQFHVFYPGPPYMLNNKDYEGYSVVKRTLKKFRLGPITFVTVQENQLGCAVHIQSGKTQYLAPGKTYQLHDKDYASIEVKTRAPSFTLGCCYFIAVEDGYLAGALNKRTGQFEVLHPGAAYRLPMDKYEPPVSKALDSHLVKCGHITQVTPQDDLLIGAYRKEDGEFITVEAPAMLHQKDYYDIQVIRRYSSEPQVFGPFVVITIKGGSAGVFNKGGVLEIKDSGWYKLDAEYEFKGYVPLNTFSSSSNVKFQTKDGVNMAVNVTASWLVNEPLNAAVFPGGFDGIQRAIPGRCTLICSKLCRQYNRDQILPTRQDVVLRATRSGAVTEDAISAMLDESDKATRELHGAVQEAFQEDLVSSLETLACGVTVKACIIENFELLDAGILDNLRQITKALAETNRQKVEAERELQGAQNYAKIAQEKARADAVVTIEKARADAAVNKEREKADAELRAAKAKAEADVRKAQAEAEAEVEIKVARSKAEARRIQIEIENESKLREAETEAAGVKARAEAENMKRKQELEAYAAMTEKQLKLELADRQVEMAKAFGKAAWLHPDRLMRVLKDYDADIRIGPDLLSVLGKNAEGGHAGAGRS